MSTQAIHASRDTHDGFFLWLRLKYLLRWLKRVVTAMLIAGSFYVGMVQAPPVLAAGYTAGDYAALTAAIDAANASAEDDVITLTDDIILSGNLPLVKSNIVFEGNHHFVDGADAYRVFFVGSGAAGAVTATAPTVVFRNLTIRHGKAQGGYGSGGGAGLGGGLFVYDGDVTAQNVVFANNVATGGAGGVGGWSGGGGMGGNGGFGNNGGNSGGGGGGGLWAGADGGGNYWSVPGGTTGNYGGGGSNHWNSSGDNTGGAGGGLGGGAGGNMSGGGGGLNGSAGSDHLGGDGGFGGGGGASLAMRGGNGGFGGGGGYGYNGGEGGFGGGGSFGRLTYEGSLLGGDGGFGGGGGVNDGAGGFGGGGNGGGGASFGGGVFVRAGTVTLQVVEFNDNSANHGAGVTNGQGKGGGAFILDSTTNANGNDLGMPGALPSVSADSCGVTFRSNAAEDDAGIGTDNDNVYGDLSNAVDACAWPTLTLSKTVEPAGGVADHTPVTYTIALANNGTESDPTVILTDSFPAEVTFGEWLEGPGSGLIWAGNAMTWTGSIAAGANITFTFTTTHTSGVGDIANTAYLSGTLQRRVDAATYTACLKNVTVQNAEDSGAGSLRQALLDICPGGSIDFAGDYGIYLSNLLSIDRSLTVDGSGHVITLSGDTGNDGTRDVQVFNIAAGSAVTLSHLSIVSGTHSTDGGGIYNAGTLTVQACTLSGNTAGTNGGGILNAGTLVVSNSTLSGNSAPYGGGINSTGSVTVVNATLTGNTGTAGSGGNIRQWGGALSFCNTILANSGDSGDCYVDDVNVILANVNNLVEDGTCSVHGIGFLTGDPVLGLLADNGGDTGTHALLRNSPAIDMGDPATCTATDQRGEPRGDLRCDIGAFEVQYSDSDTVIKSAFTGGTPYSFGPTWISITLGLADSGTVTVTKALTYPGGTQDAGEMAAMWGISSSLSTGLPLTLSFYYTDAEVAGLNESALRAFRWDGVGWTTPISTGLSVDEAANCVTLTGIEEFSTWTLFDTSSGNAPTAVTFRTFVARGRLWGVGWVAMLGAGAVFAGVSRRQRMRTSCRFGKGGFPDHQR